jgi:mevalonate kinase
MKVEFKKYPVGTVFNSISVDKSIRLLKQKIEIKYPTRLESMVFDPSKIESNDSHIYTAGQVNFTVCLFRTIKIEILENSQELIIQGLGIRRSLIKHAYLLMKNALNFETGMKIEYIDDINLKHCGLGSSSATIAGVCCAINEIYGNPISKQNL